MIGKSALVISLVVAVILASPLAYAQDKVRERALRAGAGVDKKAVDEAVKKACMWLRARQRPDGHWQPADQTCRTNKPPFLSCTALVLLALLKGGLDPDADCINKGFNYLFARKSQYILNYQVTVLILALAARCHPPEEPDEKEIKKELGKKDLTRTTLFEPPEKRHERCFKKAPRKFKKWFIDMVKWLLKKQNRDGGWSYGSGHMTWSDASNTQYAVLALHAAARCGINIPAKYFAGLASYMLKHQEKDGPEAEGFAVPVADFEIKKLKEMEKEFLDNMLKQVQVAREQGEDITAQKLKELSTAVPEIEDPYKKFGIEPHPMRARGWGYTPMSEYRMLPADDVYHRTTGSMTCSGIAALCVAKANIEGNSWYRKNRKRINSGIRDGCAWIAENFSVSENPQSLEWHYYYLYGLERAGVLALVRDFDRHNWYSQGTNYLLGKQNSDGSWPGELGREKRMASAALRLLGANLDPLINTCFAVLFLKKATAPVITVPDAIYTGSDLFGPKKKDK